MSRSTKNPSNFKIIINPKTPQFKDSGETVWTQFSTAQNEESHSNQHCNFWTRLTSKEVLIWFSFLLVYREGDQVDNVPWLSTSKLYDIYSGLPLWLSDRESACNAGGTGSIPRSERSPGEVSGNPLQYWEIPWTVAWRATVHEVARESAKQKQWYIFKQTYLKAKVKIP